MNDLHFFTLKADEVPASYQLSSHAVLCSTLLFVIELQLLSKWGRSLQLCVGHQ